MSTENDNQDRRIYAANAKVVDQQSKVAAMDDADPRKLDELRILNTMRQNAASAIMTRALTREPDEVSPSKAAE